MATRRSHLPLVLVGVAAFGLSGCAAGFSTRELAQTPAWFRAKQKELKGEDYPNLATIPAPTVAADQSGKWNAVERDLLNEQAAIAAAPRAQPAQPTDTTAFENEARGAVENARPK